MIDVSGMPSLWQAIQQAIRLEPTIYADIQRLPGGLVIAMMVVILAGLSESLGQSIILFINRVSPIRFTLSLLITAASHLIGYGLWSVTIWLLGVHVFARTESLTAAASAVGLAYAPQILAFFELTPFLGNPFSIILSLWSMVAIVVAIRIGLDLETGQAIVASGLGWTFIQLWRRTIGRPVYALGRWLQHRAAGVPLEFTLADLPVLRHYPLWLDSLDQWRSRLRKRHLTPPINRLFNKKEQPRG
ncbi:MAG: hypothetical protein R3C14_23560 [Caldilineaceae bacterium]